MSSSSKPVRQARTRVMVRPAFRERAARGVALQPPRLQIADDDPFAAEVDAPEQSAGRKQRPASRRIRGQVGGLGGRDAVERLVRSRIGPGSLDEYAGGDCAAAVDNGSYAQVHTIRAIYVCQAT